jgi:hypothetical protein
MHPFSQVFNGVNAMEILSAEYNRHLFGVQIDCPRRKVVGSDCEFQGGFVLQKFLLLPFGNRNVKKDDNYGYHTYRQARKGYGGIGELVIVNFRVDKKCEHKAHHYYD